MPQRARGAAAERGLCRRIAALFVVAALASSMSGCSLEGGGGQSKTAAEAQMSKLPGVTEALVNTKSRPSGLQVETTTTIDVTLDPGATVPDPAALVDYLLRVAWSTATKEADSRIVLMVYSEPQISVLDALDKGDWTTSGGTANAEYLAIVRATEVRDRFGDWPGEVPELPTGLIIARRSSPTP